MKLIISNIDWDYPGKQDGVTCPLPTRVVISDPPPSLLEDIDGSADNVAEYLSNFYGYCVCGFTTEVEGVSDT